MLPKSNTAILDQGEICQELPEMVMLNKREPADAQIQR